MLMHVTNTTILWVDKWVYASDCFFSRCGLTVLVGSPRTLQKHVLRLYMLQIDQYQLLNGMHLNVVGAMNNGIDMCCCMFVLYKLFNTLIHMSLMPKH